MSWATEIGIDLPHKPQHERTETRDVAVERAENDLHPLAARNIAAYDFVREFILVDTEQLADIKEHPRPRL